MGRMLGVDEASWARLSPLLDEALALPESARADWLSQLAPHMADLKPTLARLLHPAAPVLPEAPPAALADGASARRPGDLVGAWRLIEPLGRGGMGEVWLAERCDGKLQRSVALKLPHADRLQAGLAARIARERDILAALEHPAIARLYDAGIDDGQPWLALEVVRGLRIDHWCDARRASLSQRLALFEQAAAAVAYAHAQLVVHRDLKPSNLLVDEAGQVHLLDFGIAKLLDDSGRSPHDLTARGATVMTPAYASPEQVAGSPVATASDVYSLGVLLYELLAGTSPYRPARSTRAALEEAVLNDAPRRPSDACTDAGRRRALRGDLDAILLQALAKDPRQRHASVGALVDDLQRWRRHEPVLARRAGSGYVVAKFLRRHRVGATASVAVLTAVLAGAGVAGWQAERARNERARAEQVKGFLSDLLRDTSPYHAGDVGRLSAVDLMRQAWERLQGTTETPADVRVELATLIGESLVSLGDYALAEPVLAHAVSHGRSALGDGHTLTLQARLNHAQALRLRGQVAEQHQALQALVPLLRNAGQDEPKVLVQGLMHLAINAVDRGAYAESESLAAESFELARRTLGDRDPDTVASAVLLAFAHRYTQRLDAAVRQGALALRLTEDLYAGKPLHPRLAEARATYGRALAERGDLGNGIAQLQRALDDTIGLFGVDAPSVGTLRQNMVAYFLDLGDLAAAEQHADEALRLVRSAAPADSFPALGTELSQAQVRLELGRVPQALAQLTAIASGLGSLVGPDHDHAQRAAVLLARAQVLAGHLEAAAAGLAKLSLPRQPRTRAQRARAHAALAVARGDFSAAGEALAPLLDTRDTDPRVGRERAFARAEWGLALMAAGRQDEARALLVEAQAELASFQTHTSPLARAVAKALASRPS